MPSILTAAHSFYQKDEVRRSQNLHSKIILGATLAPVMALPVYRFTRCGLDSAHPVSLEFVAAWLSSVGAFPLILCGGVLFARRSDGGARRQFH